MFRENLVPAAVQCDRTCFRASRHGFRTLLSTLEAFSRLPCFQYNSTCKKYLHVEKKVAWIHNT